MAGGQAWRIEDDHLAKMIDITGETFSETMLSTCEYRDEYFGKDGKCFFVINASGMNVVHAGQLLRIDQMFPSSFEEAMLNYGLPEAEVAPAAIFLSDCLHLNPQERTSAEELMGRPWLKNAYVCC